MARIVVRVERIEGQCNLPMLVGDELIVDGSRLSIPADKYFCLWALQSMMPVFPILSEKGSLPPTHWVGKVDQFRCPDPKGGVVFSLRIEDDD